MAEGRRALVNGIVTVMSGRSPDMWTTLADLNRRMSEAERNEASLSARFEAHEMNCEERGGRVESELGGLRRLMEAHGQRTAEYFERAQRSRTQQYLSIIGTLVAVIGAFLAHDLLHWP